MNKMNILSLDQYDIKFKNKNSNAINLKEKIKEVELLCKLMGYEFSKSVRSSASESSYWTISFLIYKELYSSFSLSFSISNKLIIERVSVCDYSDTFYRGLDIEKIIEGIDRIISEL